MHTHKKPHYCSHCSYRSTYKHLDIHKQRKHNIGHKDFQCQYCTKWCYQSDHLVNHIRTLTNEKQYSCDLCFYVAATKAALTRHSRIHTGITSYQCNKSQKESMTWRINAHVKGHLELTHLKSSPLFTFSRKLLGQDSPSVHLFSIIIGSGFTAAKIKLGEDSPCWFVFSRSRFTFK